MRRHQKFFHKDDKELLHRKIEPSELKFKCQTCEKAFVREHFLKNHMRKGHPEQSETYCKHCYIIVTSRLNIHKSNIHSDLSEEEFAKKMTPDMLKFDCTLCDKKFVTENSVIYHKNVKHKDLKSAYCNLCKTSFRRTRQFRQHLDIFHTVDELKAIDFKNLTIWESIGCKKCGQYFLSQNVLNYHISHYHKKKGCFSGSAMKIKFGKVFPKKKEVYVQKRNSSS